MKKGKKKQDAYTAFALVYDQMMSEKKYTGWNGLIADVADKYAVTKGLCLDIACGTGRVSRLLIEQGFHVVGIDISKDMIAVARKKFGNKARFIRADIRDIRLGKTLQANFAVCFYDSLNYLLTDKDMLAAFRSVYRHLAPGAVFLFDMNTRAHVSASQHNKIRIFEAGNAQVIFRFGGRGRKWLLDIEMLSKRRDGRVKKQTERHVERAYDQPDIAPLLKKAGFQLFEVREEYKTYEDGCEHLSRLYFVARK